MKQPIFLTLENVLHIHKEQIRQFGGSDGIRNMGLLQSALSQPSAEFDGQFLHESLFHMAAAYLFHITLNHPFIDGNKRVGAMAADVFLQLNGYDLHPSCEDDFEKLTLDTAQGKSDKVVIAAFFKKNSRKIFKRK